MKPPPFLLLACLLLWGWQSNLTWLGILLGLLLEGLRLPSMPRWQASQQVIALWIERLSYFCIFLLVALALGLVLRNERGNSNMAWVQWAPFGLLPLALFLQSTGLPSLDRRYLPSTWQQASKAKSLQQASKASRADHPVGDQMNLAYPWCAIWLLAAAAAQPTGTVFYWALSACCAYAFWQVRRSSRRAWCLTMGSAALLGFGVHLGLYQTQSLVEEWAMEWLSNRNQDDPLQSRTALGHIGNLKLSDQIALQVTPIENGQASSRKLKTPFLLMSASYNIYQDTNWKLIGNNSFTDLPARQQDGESHWNLSTANKLSPALANGQEIEITSFSQQHHSLLQLPLNSYQVRAKASGLSRLSHNPLASVQGFMSPGYFRYRVSYADIPVPQESLASSKDLQLPDREQALLLQLAQELKLKQQTPAQQMATLQAYFAKNFRYSTWRKESQGSPLKDFLLQSRSGHCEHFATASALLLRAAGTPSRYAVGYSVQEENRMGTGYIARQRHAHAWVRVWADQHWQDFDSTPANWLEIEEDGHWDWPQDLRFYLAQLLYQWRNTQIPPSTWAILLAGLCSGWLLMRLLRGKHQGWRVMRLQRAKPNQAAEAELGDLAALIQLLSGLGLGREAQEPLWQWQARIAPQLQAAAGQDLKTLIESYYLSRFGPPETAGSQQAMQQAHLASQRWLAAWGQDGACLLNPPEVQADNA